MGFVLDNLLPGTVEERGIIKWKKAFDSSNNTSTDVASVHVYDPPFIGNLLKKRVCKYVPFLPYYGDNNKGVEDAAAAYGQGNDDL